MKIVYKGLGVDEFRQNGIYNVVKVEGKLTGDVSRVWCLDECGGVSIVPEGDYELLSAFYPVRYPCSIQQRDGGGYMVCVYQRWQEFGRWHTVYITDNLQDAINEARWYATDDQIDIFQEDFNKW